MTQVNEIQTYTSILIAMALGMVTFTITVSGLVAKFVTDTWRGRVDGLEDQVAELQRNAQTNTEYWRTKVGELEAKIKELESTVSTLRQMVSDRDKQIERMARTIDEMTATIKSLQKPQT